MGLGWGLEQPTPEPLEVSRGPLLHEMAPDAATCAAPSVALRSAAAAGWPLLQRQASPLFQKGGSAPCGARPPAPPAAKATAARQAPRRQRVRHQSPPRAAGGYPHPRN